MSGNSLSKSNLRKIALHQRQQIDTSVRIRAQENICQLFLNHIEVKKNIIVAGYYPINSEVSPLKLMQVLEQEKTVKLALPKINIATNHMKFNSWQYGDALDKNSSGLWEPQDSNSLEPDIVIVPLLAFNKHGYRLGYGGGYYDRFLAQLRCKKSVIVVGVAFSCQQIDEFVEDSYDQIMDVIITEESVLNINYRL